MDREELFQRIVATFPEADVERLRGSAEAEIVELLEKHDGFDPKYQAARETCLRLTKAALLRCGVLSRKPLEVRPRAATETVRHVPNIFQTGYQNPRMGRGGYSGGAPSTVPTGSEGRTVHRRTTQSEEVAVDSAMETGARDHVERAVRSGRSVDDIRKDAEGLIG